MSDEATAAGAAERVLQLERELAGVRAEVERARAVATAGDAGDRWKRMQEENVRLRAERERLKEEAARLRTELRRTQRREPGEGGDVIGLLESVFDLFGGGKR